MPETIRHPTPQLVVSLPLPLAAEVPVPGAAASDVGSLAELPPPATSEAVVAAVSAELTPLVGSDSCFVVTEVGVV